MFVKVKDFIFTVIVSKNKNNENILQYRSSCSKKSVHGGASQCHLVGVHTEKG
jgi:hypothetical protein